MKKNPRPKPTREERRPRARDIRAQAKQDVRKHPLLFTIYVVLRFLVLAVLVLELVMLAGFVAFGFSNPFARESLAILFDPSGLGPWFVVGLVGLGLLVPLAVEVFVTVTKRLVRALPVDLLCIAGGLVLRFCVVWSGMH